MAIFFYGGALMYVDALSKKAISQEYEGVNVHSRQALSSINTVRVDVAKTDGLVAVDPTLLRRVVDQIKNAFDMLDRRLHFRVNMEANTVVVEVVDSKTNAVISQIPSEEMQDLKKRIKQLTATFVDVKV